ncbi:MAG: tRNA pseudouridine(38-40) synthase TruA [Planctomycetes bacterium]|nr:tRNA pseudouridine(38-40) synthase TruA [Planctomycetota bacterium]
MVKKRNIKLLIEYEGTHYCGWQSQDGRQITVQETISQALKKITGQKTTLYGASRTDSGVHALGQVATFFTTSRLPPERFLFAINSYLPDDIVIKEVKDVRIGFKPQTQAKRKTYIYTIINGRVPSALRRNLIHFIVKPRLNVNRMRQAARYLVGRHDFRAFATKGHLKENCVRKIYSLAVSREKNEVKFEVVGNGFLYNMVRAIVGTLLLVGQGKMTPKNVKKILDSHDRKQAGPTAPAKGLCLIKIEY